MKQKNKLTASQQKIVDTITEEFARINEPAESGQLIDVAAIKQSVAAKQARERYVKNLRKKYNEYVLEQKRKDMELLKGYLTQLGIEIEARIGCDSFVLFPRGYCSAPSNYQKTIYYEVETETDKEFRDSVPVGISLHIYFNPNSETKFKSIEEMVKHESFIDILKSFAEVAQKD